MRKSITVNIPEPCHEDWNKMSPRDKGRHCSKCSKTVVDFTNQNDEQIVKTFEAKGNLCGRFKNQQLNREIVLSRKEKNNYRNWIASAILAFLSIGNQKSIAQSEPVKTLRKDTLRVASINGKVAYSILNEKKISGVVKAKSDGLPLPGVRVKIKNSNKETHTDFDGKYSLKVNNSDTLIFTFVSMKTHEAIVNSTTKMNLMMEDDLCSLDYVVLGYSLTSYNRNTECRKQKRKERRAKRKEERLITRKNKKQ